MSHSKNIGCKYVSLTYIEYTYSTMYMLRIIILMEIKVNIEMLCKSYFTLMLSEYIGCKLEGKAELSIA